MDRSRDRFGVGFAVAVALAAIPVLGAAARLATPCCGVIGVDSATGVATVRNNLTGRIYVATGLSAAKAGDPVQLDEGGMQVTMHKGIAAHASINEPAPGAPCCDVTGFVSDAASLRAAVESLGGTLGVDPVTPCCNIAFVQDTATGGAHVVSLEVQDQDGAHTASPLSAGLALGQPVSLDAHTGYALMSFAGHAGTFGFPVVAMKPAGPGVTKTGLTFAGVWNTDFGVMVLEQAGNHVTGTYTPKGGHIDGTAKNGVLTFKYWQDENPARGSGVFLLSADDKSFQGNYDGSETWNGTRKG